MQRRKFLKHTSMIVGAGIVTNLTPFSYAACPANAAYEDNLRDRLWMWGHDTGDYDGPGNPYNIPVTQPITMADAIKYMGIPNVCVIRKSVPHASYLEQFKDVKRITWALSMGTDNKVFSELREYVLGLRNTMPNLTGYYLDDFILGSDVRKNPDAPLVKAAISIEELEQIYQQAINYQRRLDLAMVLYTHLLVPGIKPYLKYIDLVSLWTWTGGDLNQVEKNFQKYRELVPDKPTLLGIYMWDFGGCKPIEQELMVKQLDYALKLYQQGQIDGMIFHCTPLTNKGIEAVEYSRAWIAKHGNAKRNA